MAQPLVFCRCGLAKDTVDIDGSAGQLVIYSCEHCDQPCTDKPCRFCAALAHAART